MSIAEAVHLGRHETPTARLVTSADAPRSEWLAARRNGITATDLVAIMAQSKYKTAFDVWSDKLMPPSDDDEIGEAAIWGNRLEEPVAQEWASRHGFKLRRIGLIANEAEQWQLASLDRIVHGCPDGKCALEVKTRNLFVQDAWIEALPVDVEIQARWQLLVSGLDHVHVAALIGGQRLVEHRVDRDVAAEQALVDAARIVWQSVLDNTPPNMPAELWSTEYLEQRHVDRAGSLEVDAVTLATVELYQTTLAEIKVLEEAKARYRTMLVGSLGEHETATWDGREVYSYKASTTPRLDQKELARLHPDVAADERIWKTQTTRTLRVKTERKR